MTFRWIPECASLLNTYKNQWLRRIPLNPEAPVIALEFFSWVASLMSLQLRTLVLDSLKDLLNFICTYKVWLKSLATWLILNLWKPCSESGRTGFKILFGVEWFTPMLFVLQGDSDFIKPQLLLIEMEVEEPHIEFKPSFQDCWEVIYRAFMEIIKTSENIPKV